LFLNNQKGQIEGIEIMLTLFIILLIFGAFGSYWITQERLVKEQINRYEMQSDATYAFNVILADTNSENGGIVNQKRIVDEGKLNDFINYDYTQLSEKLLIGQYDFRFRIYDSLTIYAQKGSAKTTDAVSIQRPVIYQGKPMKAELILYEK
jgi:hypothetical protein